MTQAIRYHDRDSLVKGMQSFYAGNRKLAVLTRNIPILQLHKIEIGSKKNKKSLRAYNNLKKNYFNVRVGNVAPRLYAMTFTVDSNTLDIACRLCEKGIIGAPNRTIDTFIGDQDLRKQDMQNDYIPNPKGMEGIIWVTGNYNTAYLMSEFIKANYNKDLLPRENSINLTDHMIGLAVGRLEKIDKEMQKNLEKIIKYNREKFTDPK